jgi:hypothetical protein
MIHNGKVYIMKNTIFKILTSAFILAILIFMSAACEPVEPVDPGGDPTTGVIKPTGTLEVEFRVPGSFLPPNRVLRADLSLAIDAENLYKGNLSHVANVYNSKLIYQFKLEPGSYYYKAGIICVAQGDSCSAAGFPGGQYGMKWAIGTVVIYENQTAKVVPQFTQ